MAADSERQFLSEVLSDADLDDLDLDALDACVVDARRRMADGIEQDIAFCLRKP
jgi:hypothetical protein